MAILNPSKIYNLLKELKSLITTSKAEFIGVDEAAEYLGLKKSHLYNLTHRNQIPFYKPNGKKNYFNKMELNKWISDSRNKTSKELVDDYNNSEKGKERRQINNENH